MTYGGSGDDRSKQNETREIARQKAQALRAQHKKKDRRSRVLLQGGLIVVILAIVAVVAVVITNAYLKPVSSGPLNMASDGIKIGQDLKVVKTGAHLAEDAPIPSASNATGVIDIRVYLDYQCTACSQFEKTNAKVIEAWVKSGAATIEVHPVAILDRFSMGTKYSTRAANAAACVANFSPNSFFDFNALLFDNQPKESTPGLTDKQIIALTTKAKVIHGSSIDNCVKEQTFKPWVDAATARVTAGPIPDSKITKVTETPTVIVNGVQYPGAFDSSNAFAQFVSAQAGNEFTELSTASPSPSPSGVPSD